MKNRKKYYFAAIIIILIGSLIAINLTKSQEFKHTIITEDGVLVFSSQSLRGIDKFLDLFTPTKQAAFVQTEAYVGERVTMFDYIPSKYRDKYIVDKIIFSLYEGTKRLGTYEVAFDKDNREIQRIVTSYIPDKPGIYTARTELITCDEFGLNCLQYVYYKDGYPENSVTITERPVDLTCSRLSYWSDWQRIKEVANGFIQERVYNQINSNCFYDEVKTEKIIMCNDDFLIKDTENSVGSYSGKEICVPKEMALLEVNLSEFNTILQAECSVDLIESCEGEKIIAKRCITGRFEDTDRTCTISKKQNIFPIIAFGILVVVVIIITGTIIAKRR